MNIIDTLKESVIEVLDSHIRKTLSSINTGDKSISHLPILNNKNVRCFRNFKKYHGGK